MKNRMDWRAEDRPGVVSDYDHFMDGVDEFVFVPLTAATFGNGMTTYTVDDGGDTNPPARSDAA